MNENAAIIARIVKHNTGGKNTETIAREQVGTIAHHHGRFDGDLRTAITETIEEGYLEEQDGELVATDEVNELIRGRRHSMG
ncbi:hypothetical protein [Halomicrococcus sp. NG-SE-24]|uniref:hypothetical protein n=1 Tax=Halomicrococcus sp. NG-SE-24 TaxID=3436928 RepID=UPI003D97A5B5